MAYLTFKEYNDMGFSRVPDEDAFNKVEPYAEILFDVQTKNFYRIHDLENDVPERAKLFKRALALQVEFSHDVGVATPYEVAQNNVTHFSVGRTSVDSGDIRTATRGNTGLYSVAYSLLVRTGLLYRGVCSC